MKPLAIELYAGKFGWGEGLVAEGWRVVGFDILHESYHGDVPVGCELVLQDVCTLHGAQFKDADLFVCSPPCQEFSYRAMPWKRAKALPPPVLGTNLFWQCWRIQHEACEASGRYIPMVVENVRGAQKWVGDAKWKYKSFHLWGAVPALMPIAIKGFKGFKREWRDCEASRRWSSHSKERIAWSAAIAKIPEPLARHMARVFKPVCDG